MTLASEREDQRRAFLAGAGLADAARQPLQGDASTRAYERLITPTGGRLILMDQHASLESPPCPPDATPEERAALGYNALARLAAGRVDAFLAVAGWLRGLGLSAPEVVVADPPLGLAVLEDLGDDLFAHLMEAGAAEGPFYDAATDLLLALHARKPPDVVEGNGCRWPLLPYDGLALKTYLDIFLEWFPRLKSLPPFPPGAIAEWEAIWAPVRALADAGATVFCHRDYHAENLIWLPDRAGVARVGLLDFQDAVLAHPAWDLSMLLHDARRDVSPERREAVLARYLAARPELDRETFLRDFNALGAINIARILALFSRLVARDGKPRYLGFMGRLWRYLEEALRAAGPTGLEIWLARYVPVEARG